MRLPKATAGLSRRVRLLKSLACDGVSGWARVSDFCLRQASVEAGDASKILHYAPRPHGSQT